jgi:hypothetical protein
MAVSVASAVRVTTASPTAFRATPAPVELIVL